MSHEYQRRSTYFYELWLESIGDGNDWGFEYTNEIVDAYTPSIEYLEWAVDVGLRSRTYGALTRLHRMRPRQTAIG